VSLSLVAACGIVRVGDGVAVLEAACDVRNNGCNSSSNDDRNIIVVFAPNLFFFFFFFCSYYDSSLEVL
jgi:hypothetical protein